MHFVLSRRTYSYLLLDLFLIFHFSIKISGIKVIGNNTSVRYGEKATLFSQLTDTEDSLSRITWWKKTRENSVQTRFLTILPDGSTEHHNGLGDRVKFIGSITEKTGTIQLSGMRLLDEGVYTCIFSLFPSGPFEANLNVTVYVPPEVAVMEETPVAGDLNATLASCFASNARPAAKVLWTLGPLQNTLRTETDQTDHPNGTFSVMSKLIGPSLKHLNQEKVQCVITHEALTEKLVLEYSINIHFPPASVRIIPDSLTEAKTFQCLADSNPSPTNYIWNSLNETSLQSEGNKLLVPKLSSDFNGLYTCNATNQYGSASGSIYVHVHTGSSSVCWGLFGFVIFTAAFGLVVYLLWTFWKWKQSPANEREQEGTAAEAQELQQGT